MGRQEAPLRLESGFCDGQVGPCLIDGELIGHRVDLKKQVALPDVGILRDRYVDDPATDFRRDVDDVSIDARIVGRRHDRAAVQHVEAEAGRRGNDCERNQDRPGGATTRTCRLHGYCPNQSIHASRPQHRPIAAQTKS